jgi:hypothetical protein
LPFGVIPLIAAPVNTASTSTSPPAGDGLGEGFGDGEAFGDGEGLGEGEAVGDGDGDGDGEDIADGDVVGDDEADAPVVHTAKIESNSATLNKPARKPK